MISRLLLSVSHVLRTVAEGRESCLFIHSPTLVDKQPLLAREDAHPVYTETQLERLASFP